MNDPKNDNSYERDLTKLISDFLRNHLKKLFFSLGSVKKLLFFCICRYSKTSCKLPERYLNPGQQFGEEVRMDFRLPTGKHYRQTKKELNKHPILYFFCEATSIDVYPSVHPSAPRSFFLF